MRKWDINTNFRQLEYRYWITKYQGHAREIAEEISLMEEDEKRLIIVGGDGTIKRGNRSEIYVP